MNYFKKSDEKNPLLYLILDKDTARCSNNKNFFNRRAGITTGVSNILGEWPGYLKTCWVSSLMFILAVLSVFVLLTTALSTYRLHRIPRCTTGDDPMLDNNTIHLVHGPNPWNQHQLDMVQKIIQVFPDHRIHLLMIKRQKFSGLFDEDPITLDAHRTTIPPTPVTVPGRKLLRLLEDPSEKTNSIFRKDGMVSGLNSESLFSWPFFNPKDFINTFLKRSIRKSLKEITTTSKPMRVTNLAALLLRYPSIYVKSQTFEEAFEKSPLFLSWHHLNDETKIFSIRALQLWQYGGLSFDLVRTKNMSEVYTENVVITTDHSITSMENSTHLKMKDVKNEKRGTESVDSNAYIDSLLYLGYSNFQMIPGGVVTLAENGCHMETKSACHSFFGEVLYNLQYGNILTTPEDVIKAALKYFLRPSHRGFRGH